MLWSVGFLFWPHGSLFSFTLTHLSSFCQKISIWLPSTSSTTLNNLPSFLSTPLFACHPHFLSEEKENICLSLSLYLLGGAAETPSSLSADHWSPVTVTSLLLRQTALCCPPKIRPDPVGISATTLCSWSILPAVSDSPSVGSHNSW